ncbi:MAG: EAL domain-containing protein [Lachnospiraceae bacterium]|nr:EAL domain-containing protein [Lachnospiraceae bacterium]
MDYVTSYEGVAVLLLFAVFFCYIYRNWLDLKRNKIFYWLLVIAMVAVSIDLIGRIYLSSGTSKIILFEATVVATIADIGLLTTCWMLFFYALAITGNMQYIRTNKVIMIMLWSSFVMDMILLTNPWTHIVFWYGSLQQGDYHAGKALPILIIYVEAYLLAVVNVILDNRRKLPGTHANMIIATVLILMFLVFMQFTFPVFWRLSYFFLSLILTMYYLLMHMSDQHLAHRSRCFSQVGFRIIVEEKARYRENFSCVAVNINNISSMINVCTEEELDQVHYVIAAHMRAVGSRHALYQLYDSEFILMTRDMDRALDACYRLQDELPRVIRVNDKNIPVMYGFYVMPFADADYSVGDFYRIIAGLRKMTREVTDYTEIVYYEGEIKESLQRELMSIQKTKDALSGDGFALQTTPIYDTQSGDVEALDTKMLLDMGDGTSLENGDIWKIAEENGNGKEVTLWFLNKVMRFAVQNRIFQKGIRRIHINMSTMQIRSKRLIEQYCDTLLFYQVRPEQVVIEIFVDQEVPEQILEKNIQYLRDKGFQVLLDEFGVNVCNLKNMLSFPFDMVKLNAEMTMRFLDDKREELEHLVHMLKKQNWTIYIDGIDDKSSLKTFREMGVSGIQGKSVSSYMKEEEFSDWLRERGGSEIVSDAL